MPQYQVFDQEDKIIEKEDNTDTSSVNNDNNGEGIVLNDQDSSFSEIFA